MVKPIKVLDPPVARLTFRTTYFSRPWPSYPLFLNRVCTRIANWIGVESVGKEFPKLRPIRPTVHLMAEDPIYSNILNLQNNKSALIQCIAYGSHILPLK